MTILPHNKAKKLLTRKRNKQTREHRTKKPDQRSIFCMYWVVFGGITSCGSTQLEAQSLNAHENQRSEEMGFRTHTHGLSYISAVFHM
jgi:hypothetical protein